MPCFHDGFSPRLLLGLPVSPVSGGPNTTLSSAPRRTRDTRPLSPGPQIHLDSYAIQFFQDPDGSWSAVSSPTAYPDLSPVLHLPITSLLTSVGVNPVRGSSAVGVIKLGPSTTSQLRPIMHHAEGSWRLADLRTISEDDIRPPRPGLCLSLGSSTVG